MTVTYDQADQAWVATRAGEELGRNHQLRPDAEMCARKWLGWLTGGPVPLTDSEERVLESVMHATGVGVGSAFSMILAALKGVPGYVTDEYVQWNVGMLTAVACTNLDDELALHRARSCPSGTSGGWIRTDSQGPEECPDRPGYRHILFEAG